MNWENMFTVGAIILGVATFFVTFLYPVIEGRHKKLMLAALFITTLIFAMLAAGLTTP